MADQTGRLSRGQIKTTHRRRRHCSARKDNRQTIKYFVPQNKSQIYYKINYNFLFAFRTISSSSATSSSITTGTLHLVSVRTPLPLVCIPTLCVHFRMRFTVAIDRTLTFSVSMQCLTVKQSSQSSCPVLCSLS